MHLCMAQEIMASLCDPLLMILGLPYYIVARNSNTTIIT